MSLSLPPIEDIAREAVPPQPAQAPEDPALAATADAFVRERLEREAARLNPTEREALRRRLAIADETERRLAEIAAGNEAALTALDDVAVAVARIDTGRSQAGAAGNMEQALQELRRFAERAGLYGRKP